MAMDNLAVCIIIMKHYYINIKNTEYCVLNYVSLFPGVQSGVRPPKCARPPFPDRRAPYKSSIMHVVWISVSTYVVWSDYK